MIEYEEETEGNSIYKFIEKPRLKEISNGERILGKIELTKGYLDWLKKKNVNR